MSLVTAEQMRRLDRQARRDFKIPELILMEHAGTKVAQVVKRLPSSSRGVVVLAGGGSNGGDGLVAARHLDNWGIPVEVALFKPATRITGAAKTNLEIVQRLKIPVALTHSAGLWRRWSRRKHFSGVVIDALLGTGLFGPVREPFASAIDWTRHQSAPVVSVDLPSGLDADTGGIWGQAVRAKVTVTCGAEKVGLRRKMGKKMSGRIIVADISLPRKLRRWTS